VASGQETSQRPKALEGPRREPKPKLQIVKLEERITPDTRINHNETMVGELEKSPTVCGKQRKLQIVKLEERIAPKLSANHNETLVRKPAKPANIRQDKKLQIVKLEERLAPGVSLNHNESLVRESSTKFEIVKLEERITPTPSIPIPPP
jgi:hypothetical protein